MCRILLTMALALLVLIATGVVHVDLLVHHDDHGHGAEHPEDQQGDDAPHLHTCSANHHVTPTPAVSGCGAAPAEATGVVPDAFRALLPLRFTTSIFRPPRA